MGRILASIVIALLLVLDLALPYTPLGRRGTEARVRRDIPGAIGEIGQTLPPFTLLDLAGAPVRLSDFRGRRVVLTFERSIDW